ncbi:hypothetical protein [Streptomyces liangshanensis]|uniref:Secreted protein n=1 Tax=Streptomyces liangshanensis TaxID=2717324 RepID=A0A6G9GX69_9ACTN|nr:hypothetical protein [Streptomyces liangshanensis]QIQ02649.1 hypothetical protein HA039_10245 [Streptomyces liangshanensis]
MRLKRLILTLLGILALVLGSLLTAGPAQAAAPADHRAAGPALTAPPAPAGIGPAFAPAAVPPTISPAVTTTHVAPGGSYTCAYGNFCALAWDPTTASWKVFYLYNCARYALANWNGGGAYWNNQTPSARSTFYGSSGNVLKGPFAPGGGQQNYDWTLVWSIRNC